MDVFKMADYDDHEQVVFCSQPDVGLRAIIAIHDTTLGPSLGGCRFYPYNSNEEALRDVLRLSRGMTYKSAVAGLDVGGGKSVIIGDPKTGKRESLFRAFGRFLESLGGRYIAAEDVNTCVQDMDWIHQETRYVTGISPSSGGSGDPSAMTALGVFRGIKASLKTKLGCEDLEGRKVAIQGVGRVGYNLCHHLHEAGAKLFIADVNREAVDRAAIEFDAVVTECDLIHALDVDVFAPCALGAVLNDRTIPEIKASIVAGGANNQLAVADRHGKALHKRRILYAPDYAINSGGIINVASELNGYNREWVLNKVEEIYATLMKIYSMSEEEGISTNEAADYLARARLRSSDKIKTIYIGTPQAVSGEG